MASEKLVQIPLKLLPSDRPQREACAWLLPMASCAEHLAELTTWNTSLTGVRLLRLRVGLLVVASSNDVPPTTLRARPYGRLAENLYVPVEARLNASVSKSELAGMFSGKGTFVWHPTAGPFLVAASEELRVAELLADVPLEARDWSRAQPGTAFNGRILSLVPEEAPGAQDLWRDVQDDIGSRRPTLEDLPRSPGEPSNNPIAHLGRAARAQLAKFMQWMSQAAKAKAADKGQPERQPTAPARQQQRSGSGGLLGAAGTMLSQWASAASQWANQQLSKWSEALETERHREISRLLNMLSSDPDAGLRYAIPFGSEAGRGIAPPSSRLVERNVNFRLGGGSGGGPVDAWNISAEQQIKLIARYRELANREIALGRHRRAAYIFAHLLGDFISAARTLADGGHFREAATLYEEKLGQALEAAHCLEQGGLWTEAIAIYERLGKDEKVGDLYRQLDQPQQAEIAYRREVEKNLRADDRLGAARLLEEKLEVPDEAVQVLLAGWPDSVQAIRCVDASFKLLARLSQHDQAERHVRRLRQYSDGSLSLSRQLAQCYAELATTYPSAEVRHVAADQTRLMAACHLDGATGSELTGLTDALRKLAPQDRLLSRDAHRYALEGARRVAPAVRTRKTAITLVRQISLPPAQWTTLQAAGEGFYAAGQSNNLAQVARASWSGENLQRCSDSRWKVVHSDVRDLVVLLAVNPSFGKVVVHVAYGEPFQGEQTLPQTSVFGRELVGGHPGVGHNCLLAGYDARGGFNAVNLDRYHELTWSKYASLQPHLLGTHRIGWESIVEHLDDAADDVESLPMYPTPLAVVDDALYLAFQKRLLVFRPNQSLRQIQLPGRIDQVTTSPAWTRLRIVVSLEDGGLILWGDDENAPRARFAEGLGWPKCCLARGGLLVAAADGVMEVFDTRDAKLVHLAMKAEPAFRPVAVAATDQPNEFAVLVEDGVVLVYRVEGCP